MASIFKRKNNQGRRGRPWYIGYTDEHGRRRTVRGCPGVSGQGRYEPDSPHLESQVELRRRGVRTADDAQLETQGKRSIAKHVKDYLADCEFLGQSPTHINIRRTQLNRLIEHTRVVHLGELEANNVVRFLHDLKRKGRSARTVNHHRATAVAFLNWCVSKTRLDANPLSGKGTLKLLDEKLDKRRTRRAMSNDELAWLLAKSPPHRSIIYRVAYWTGLRRKELRHILVGDFDLKHRVIHVRADVSKAKRDDFIPLRPALAEKLAELRAEQANSTDRMFPTLRSIRTFHSDCARARQAWIDEAPDDAECERREESEFLLRYDAAGRHLDFHGMRMTLATHLARKVRPPVIQRILRHTDLKTTMNHYMDLQLSDDAAAIESMPEIEVQGTITEADPIQEVTATGTDDVSAVDGVLMSGAQRMRSDQVAQHALHGNDWHDQPDQSASTPMIGGPAQAPYNQAVGNDCHTMTNDGEINDVNDRNSLNKGRLDELASRSRL